MGIKKTKNPVLKKSKLLLLFGLTYIDHRTN